MNPTPGTARAILDVWTGPAPTSVDPMRVKVRAEWPALAAALDAAEAEVEAMHERRRASAELARAVSRARIRARTDERIDELEFLYANGTSLADAVPRIGWTFRAAHSALARRGHPLARQLAPLAHRERKDAR